MCGRVKSLKTNFGGASSHEQVCHKECGFPPIHLDHVVCDPVHCLGAHVRGANAGVGCPSAWGGVP